MMVSVYECLLFFKKAHFGTEMSSPNQVVFNGFHTKEVPLANRRGLSQSHKNQSKLTLSKCS